MNSELQLKADQDSQDDSFIEVITVSVKINTTFAKHLKHNKICSGSAGSKRRSNLYSSPKYETHKLVTQK